MLDTRDYTNKAPYLQDDNNEIFESDNISECLDYFRETKDSEPLENAITNAETIIEIQIAEIQFLIDLSIQCDNRLVANRLIAVRNKFKTLLK